MATMATMRRWTMDDGRCDSDGDRWRRNSLLFNVNTSDSSIGKSAVSGGLADVRGVDRYRTTDEAKAKAPAESPPTLWALVHFKPIVATRLSIIVSSSHQYINPGPMRSNAYDRGFIRDFGEVIFPLALRVKEKAEGSMM